MLVSPSCLLQIPLNCEITENLSLQFRRIKDFLLHVLVAILFRRGEPYERCYDEHLCEIILFLGQKSFKDIFTLSSAWWPLC